MTKKQKENYNKMLAALRTISKDFATPNQLHKIAEKEYGCTPDEAIEMTFENIQELAGRTSKGIRSVK